MNSITMKMSPETLKTFAALIVTIGIFAALMLYPHLAFAQDAKSYIADKEQKAYDLVYDIVYGGLGIALVIAFGMAAFSRVEWSTFFRIGGAIVGLGCVSALIQYFQ